LVEYKVKKNLRSHVFIYSTLYPLVIHYIKKQMDALNFYLKVISFSFTFCIYNFMLYVIMVDHNPHFRYMIDEQTIYFVRTYFCANRLTTVYFIFVSRSRLQRILNSF